MRARRGPYVLFRAAQFAFLSSFLPPESSHSVHRRRGGARVLEGKMGVYSMVEHASFFSFCGDFCCVGAL